MTIAATAPKRRAAAINLRRFLTTRISHRERTRETRKASPGLIKVGLQHLRLIQVAKFRGVTRRGKLIINGVLSDGGVEDPWPKNFGKRVRGNDGQDQYSNHNIAGQPRP